MNTEQPVNWVFFGWFLCALSGFIVGLIVGASIL